MYAMSCYMANSWTRLYSDNVEYPTPAKSVSYAIRSINSKQETLK